MKITIIGASGNIGSAAAFYIAVQGLADEIVMIDPPRPDLLNQYVYDLTAAASHHDVLVRAGVDKDMKDSDIVISAAGAGSAGIMKSRLEFLPKNIPIVKSICVNIQRYCPEAAVITASNPVCPLNYAMSLCSGLDRKQLIGYSGNDSIRFRLLMARELGVKTSRVEAFVIGEHGNSQVPLFSSVRVDGKPVDISEEIEAQGAAAGRRDPGRAGRNADSYRPHRRLDHGRRAGGPLPCDRDGRRQGVSLLHRPRRRVRRS